PLIFRLLRRTPRRSTFPYTTLFRSRPGPGAELYGRIAAAVFCPRSATEGSAWAEGSADDHGRSARAHHPCVIRRAAGATGDFRRDRKSTRLNSSHRTISYAVFCLKK